jgi:hypothetical protein
VEVVDRLLALHVLRVDWTDERKHSVRGGHDEMSEYVPAPTHEA